MAKVTSPGSQKPRVPFPPAAPAASILSSLCARSELSFRIAPEQAGVKSRELKSILDGALRGPQG
jgi:hypothetical protein